MIDHLRGKLVLNEGGVCVIECGGVGYLATVSALTGAAMALADPEDATLYTYLAVRQDGIELYGFADRREMSCFKTMIGVSGVGPKVALAILSTLNPEQLALAVAQGDAVSITRAPGVGPKLANRMLLELKDKMDAALLPVGGEDILRASEPLGAAADEAAKALMALGYSRSQAQKAVSEVEAGMSVEDTIRAALRILR